MPDLAGARTQSLTGGQLVSFIEQGARWTGMPAWKRELSADEMWELVALIRRRPAFEPAETESAGGRLRIRNEGS